MLTIKANQPRLHAALKKLPWAKVPSSSTVATGHGPRTRRTIKVLAAPT